MSLFEAQNAMIRGTMIGCTGDFKMNVLADAADVADSVNIVLGAVTIQYSSHYFNKWVNGANEVLLTLDVNVPDTTAFVEVLFYGERGGECYFDNSRVISRSGNISSSLGFCLRDIYRANRGIHHLKILSSDYGYSRHGFIVCRYIRDTGSLNA